MAGVRRIIGAGCIGFILASRPAPAAAPPPADPMQISIGGGAADSAAFRWSSALSEILSRPPGLPDCDTAGPCGVPGIIAGAQTFEDPRKLLKALADGKVTTAIIPAMRVYEAHCAMIKDGSVAPIWAMKTLYRQTLKIVIRSDAKINGPKDFAGKPVVIGEVGGDSETIALALLDAYGTPRKKVKLTRLSPRLAVDALKSGAASAGVFIGQALDTPLAALIGQGFTLLSLPDSPERQRLSHALPVLEADAIPPGAYPGIPAISTLAQPVIWAAGPGLDPILAERLVAALSEPHNLARLSELIEPVAPVPEGEAFLRLPAPPAVGILHFAQIKHLPVSEVECPGK